MENNIYTDNFESFLKESTDEFRMVASRRVWYSIYNNMHPDRRWPSVAVCLIILVGILYIGVSTNNSLSLAVQKSNARHFTGLAAGQPDNVRMANADDEAFVPRITHVYHHTAVNPALVVSNVTAEGTAGTSLLADLLALAAATNNLLNNKPPAVSKTENSTLPPSAATIAISNKKSVLPRETDLNMENATTVETIAATIGNNEDAPVVKIAAAENAAKTKTADAINVKAALKAQQENTRSWTEDFALRNRPQYHKFRARASVNYFVTPSLGYRDLFRNNLGVPVATGLTDVRALNMELGAVLQYRVTSRLRIKGGVQVNYNNYVSKVTDLNHPVQTTLLLNDRAADFRSSFYTVQEGAARLNRGTVQLSIPLGADFKLANLGNKIAWYAGGTLQPGYVIGASGYVLSADTKSYIHENDLVRRFTASSAAETFLSFRTARGVTFSAGPQFRYQLLSTYKPTYVYTEKLYTLGFKLGLATGF